MRKNIERIYTESQLREMCEHYQCLLKIQDWNIEVRLVPQRNLDDSDARVLLGYEVRNASIEIATPDTWTPGFFPRFQDMRRDLIHELLHIVFVDAIPHYEKGSLRHKAYEIAIDTAAEALASRVEDIPFMSDMELEGPDSGIDAAPSNADYKRHLDELVNSHLEEPQENVDIHDDSGCNRVI